MALVPAEPATPENWATADLGSALVDGGRKAAADESRWLGLLAEFDRREGWYLDGQLSAVDWLAWRLGMSVRTARDKLRVAHELRRRPAVAEALADGRLSYCKVRALTRVTDGGEETDRWLLALAEKGTVRDVERAVRHCQTLADQEKGVDDYLRRWERRGVAASRTYDGMMVLEVVLPVEEGEEVLAVLQGTTADNHLDNHLNKPLDKPVDKPVEDGSREPQATPRQRRADGLLELVRGSRAAADRYTLHLVADIDALAGREGGAALPDGSPIAMETLRRLACDCGVVRHLVRGASEPLDVGRRTPVWTVAQRRAIWVRDGGHCRFIGCRRQVCDVHHLRHFADGGATAVSNGILLCRRHHTAVHEGGFGIAGDPNGVLTFYRADGTALEGPGAQLPPSFALRSLVPSGS